MNIIKKFIAFFKSADTIGRTSIVLCFINFLVFVASLIFKFDPTLILLIIDGILFALCSVSFSRTSKKLNKIDSIIK